MDYENVLKNAKQNIGKNCKVCPVCDGLACGNTLPGPGSKGPGNGAYDNFCAWKKYKLNMDTIVANSPIDTTTSLFGKELSFPLLTAPIGSIRLQFNPSDDVRDFNEKCMAACEDRSLLHFYSTAMNPKVQEAAINSRILHDNRGIPVINPEDNSDILSKLKICQRDTPPVAVGVVVDSAGLPHLKFCGGSAGAKSVEQLLSIKKELSIPFVIKGIMTIEGAKKAVAAGADAIIVSNHGGRVLSDTPATAEVLYEIAQAVGEEVKIIVDGGIRSGIDVFKALALGADYCMICRPVLISYYGGQKEGIEAFFDKIKEELIDTMYMCGARSVSDITDKMIRS